MHGLACSLSAKATGSMGSAALDRRADSFTAVNELGSSAIKPAGGEMVRMMS